MSHSQPGIFALGATEHEYLEFDLLPSVDPVTLVAALADLDGPWATTGGVNVVVGFRPSLWRGLSAAATPADAEDFTEPIVGAGGYTMPATQHDAWVWIAAADHSHAFDTATVVIAALRGIATVATDVTGWHYRESRDLSGFVDGTENPALIEAPGIASVPAGEPGAGASVLLYQQWRHEPAWLDLPVSEQEAAMGRTKADDVEMDDDTKPESAHIARTVVEQDDEEFEIFRRNVGYGTATVHGTLFVGFACDQWRMAEMLRRMAGVGDGVRDALTRFMTPLTGAYYVVPSTTALAAYGEDAETD